MFPPPLSWQRCWRAIWFAIALLYASFDLTAEFIMARTVNGKPQPASIVLSEADRAVSLFPFDMRLREYRRWVRHEVARKLSQPQE